MAANLSQQDIRDLRRRITAKNNTPLRDRISACEILLDVYPSLKNKRFVKRFVREWRRTHSGLRKGKILEFEMKLKKQQILENREKQKEKQKASDSSAPPTPPSMPAGTAAIAPGDDGNNYYVDVAGAVLGMVPAEPSPKHVFSKD